MRSVIIFAAAALFCAGCATESPDIQRKWLYTGDVTQYLNDVGGVALPCSPGPVPRDVRYRPVASYTPAPYYRIYAASPATSYRGTTTYVDAAAPTVVNSPRQPMVYAPPVRAVYTTPAVRYATPTATTYVTPTMRSGSVVPSRAVYGVPGTSRETATVYVHRAPAVTMTSTGSSVGPVPPPPLPGVPTTTTTTYGYVAPRASYPPTPVPYTPRVNVAVEDAHRGDTGLAARRTTYEAARHSR